MPNCPTCGTYVPEQAAFCPDCGTDMKSVADAGTLQESTPLPAENAGAAPDAGAAPGIPDAGGTAAGPTLVEGLDPAPVAEAAVAAIPSGPGSPDAAPAPVDDAATVSPAAPSAPAPAGTARLTLKRSGMLTSEVFEFGERVTIGRFDPESGPIDIDMGRLPESSYVSRHHAEIRRDPSGQWSIRDLGSRNGTFVRSQADGQFQRITEEHALNDGDEVALGNARFEFRTA